MIDEELKEALGELINISFGYATATIADLFDNFATLHVPAISIIPLAEINRSVMAGFDEEKIYVTNQQFKGQFQGEVLLVLGGQSAQNLQIILSEEEKESEHDLQQNLLEISNILCSACISKLSELLVTDVSFAPPTIDLADQLIKNVDNSPYSHVVLVSTVLEFEEAKINGKMFIMFSDEIFSWLEEALIDFMDNI